MASNNRCAGSDGTPKLEERPCPVCGEEVEVFLRKGRICEESVCPKCGYKFEIQPEPVIVPRQVPDQAE
jgi:transcription elongation factor Elf1